MFHTKIVCLRDCFTYYFVPETFGKPLEEMEEHYRKICYPNQLGKSDDKPEIINMSYIEE